MTATGIKRLPPAPASARATASATSALGAELFGCCLPPLAVPREHERPRKAGTDSRLCCGGCEVADAHAEHRRAGCEPFYRRDRRKGLILTDDLAGGGRDDDAEVLRRSGLLAPQLSLHGLRAGHRGQELDCGAPHAWLAVAELEGDLPGAPSVSTLARSVALVFVMSALLGVG